jgi:hypothetical protein
MESRSHFYQQVTNLNFTVGIAIYSNIHILVMKKMSISLVHGLARKVLRYIFFWFIKKIISYPQIGFNLHVSFAILFE